MSSFNPHICPECFEDIQTENDRAIYTHNGVDYSIHKYCYADFSMMVENYLDNTNLLHFFNRLNKYCLSDFDTDWPRSHPDYIWRYPFYDAETDKYYDHNPLSYDIPTDKRAKIMNISNALKWKKTVPIEPYIPPSPNYDFLRIFSVPYCPPLRYSD